MASWIGPAVVAAAIVALVSIAGWFVSASLGLRAEERRRERKARDFRIALRAEIMSEIVELQTYEDTDPAFLDMSESNVPTISNFVPKGTRNRIYESIIGEIYILPAQVIAPLVLYARQRDIVEGLREDLRGVEAAAATDRQRLQLFKDYVKLRHSLKLFAEEAVKAIDEFGP